MKRQRSSSLNNLTNDTLLRRPTLDFNILTSNYIFLMPDNYEQLAPPTCNNIFVTTHSEFNLIKQTSYWYKPRLLAKAKRNVFCRLHCLHESQSPPVEQVYAMPFRLRERTPSSESDEIDFETSINALMTVSFYAMGRLTYTTATHFPDNNG